MFSSIPELLEELVQGRPVILVDDEDRENEGDLVMAAQHMTTEWMAFFIRYTGGVVCLAMTEALADHLNLPPMVAENSAPRGTAFTVSIEAREGISTGISAADRATTVRLAAQDGVGPGDFVRPGHIFPLRAREGGVLRRAGHTEASVDLCRLAGLKPVAAISELMHDDGQMMRLPAILAFARQHQLKVGSIADLIRYRLAQGDRYVLREAEARLPTRFGEFRLVGYRDQLTQEEHAALTIGPVGANPEQPILVRVHSECLTGDALHSLRCDCGFQRDLALERMAREGCGVLVYLRQEGRGIGLINKIRAYALQDAGQDTVEANLTLGFPPDLREYGVGAQILSDLGVRRLRLLTNNPRKVRALSGYGLEIVERLSLQAGLNPHNQRYLAAKRKRLGHWLSALEPE